MMYKKILFILSLGLFAVVSCSSGNSNSTSQELFSSEVTEVLVEVDYMPQAEPYTGTITVGDPVWDFFKNNLSALFNETKMITVPTSLDEMEQIPPGNSNYSQSDILDLAEKYRNNPSIENNKASIYIVFVDGFFIKDGETNTSVLGVSFGDTGVIAMFKKALEANTFPNERLRKFTEQSVLIHEAGHAIGLVNNGIPLTSNHHDNANGSHCTNTKCVMYYLNEGVIDLIEFLRSGDPSVENVIYGQECLNDAQAMVEKNASRMKIQ